MATRLSAIEAISPAIEMARRQLFQPFRGTHWARLALVALVMLLTGDLGFNLHLPLWRTRRARLPDLGTLSSSGVEKILAWLPAFLLLVIATVAFALLLLYIHSVFRFVLFDSVLYNRCEIKAGWRRWHPQGISYFLWLIGFGLVLFLGLALLVGLPLGWASAQGIFRQPGQHVPLLIGGSLLLLLLVFAYLVVAAVVALFAKDFLVPIMALDNVGVLEAWRRFFPMLEQDKGGYAIYVLMKVALAIGVGILFGLASLVALLLLIIPFGALALGLSLIWASVGLHWNPVTIGVAVLLGLLALATALYIMGWLFTPVAVFLQAYVIVFFAGRYPALGNLLAPPPPAAPPVPTPMPAAAG